MIYDGNEHMDLMEILEAVPDPRCTRGVRYRFSHLLLMCVYAVLAGHSEAKVMYKIRAAHWNIEMQHWILDIQLKEDQQTARKNNAVTNGSILRRFCMMLKKQDTELSEKPMKRFLMANEHDPNRIEKLLFENVAQKASGF